MGFTSSVFLFVLLPLSIVLYICASLTKNERIIRIILLLLSFLFCLWYGTRPTVILIIIVILTYLAGNTIYYAKKNSPITAKAWLIVSCLSVVFYLFLSKYLGFLIQQLNRLFSIRFSLPSYLIIIGISFVIFEIISYLTDIYRGLADPGTIDELFLFIMFFPKLISGPIVLWRDFSINVPVKKYDWFRIAQGIERIVIGYAKKAIIADTFGMHIQLIQSGMNHAGVDTLTIWLRSILYFFQIYYDFSGYSDIAIGLSQVFGIEVKENFNFPYLSLSINEFWRRWHISLGTWFREYVYIPLGGNRKGNVYLHLLIVFILTGIWHGANWTFLIWGIIHGLFVVIERAIREHKWYIKMPKALKWFCTTIIVFFGWTLFMSDSISSFVETIRLMFTHSTTAIDLSWRYYFTLKILILLLIAIIGSMSRVFRINLGKLNVEKSTLALSIRYAGILCLFVLAVMFIVNSSYSPFLYFQF